jgi:hypothetical protein
MKRLSISSRDSVTFAGSCSSCNRGSNVDCELATDHVGTKRMARMTRLVSNRSDVQKVLSMEVHVVNMRDFVSETSNWALRGFRVTYAQYCASTSCGIPRIASRGNVHKKDG